MSSRIQKATPGGGRDIASGNGTPKVESQVRPAVRWRRILLPVVAGVAGLAMVGLLVVLALAFAAFVVAIVALTLAGAAVTAALRLTSGRGGRSTPMRERNEKRVIEGEVVRRDEY